MKTLKVLLDSNKKWAEKVKQQEPSFFSKLAEQQSPKYLWIGCSDSRVPANQIVGLMPGEIFVHRNVGNVVAHTDVNCLSVIQYAVAVLKVQHVILCGHYGCGGVLAALAGGEWHGPINKWLRHIRDVYDKHKQNLLELSDDGSRLDRLCELNVIEQVNNVCHTAVIQKAWEDGQELSVHGWIYDIHDGIIRDLDMCITSPEDLDAALK